MEAKPIPERVVESVPAEETPRIIWIRKLDRLETTQFSNPSGN